MPVSEKQLVANRENAKLGGVKTEEGKALIKFNARKHGILSKEILIDGENGGELSRLRDQITSELQPSNCMEALMVDQIIAYTWRLKRAMMIEKQILQKEMRDFMQPDKENTDEDLGLAFVRNAHGHNYMITLSRYITSIERGLYRAINQIKECKASSS